MSAVLFDLVNKKAELESHPDGVIVVGVDKSTTYLFKGNPAPVTDLVDIEKFRTLQHLLVEVEMEEGVNDEEEEQEEGEKGEASREGPDMEQGADKSDPETPSGKTDEPATEGDASDYDKKIMDMLEEGTPFSKSSLKEILSPDVMENMDDIYDGFLKRHEDELRKFGHRYFLKNHIDNS